MNEEDKNKLIEEKNRICEAWFMFSRRDAHGLVRWLCFFVLCCFSIAFFYAESITALGKACLLFTVSLFMEFIPLFTKFPVAVTYNSNIKLLRKKKALAIIFYCVLILLFLFSLYLSFSIAPPQLSLICASWIFIGLYFVVFIYLLINCILGMGYVPEVAKEKEDRKENMYLAAEVGNLGNIPQNNS